MRSFPGVLAAAALGLLAGTVRAEEPWQDASAKVLASPASPQIEALRQQAKAIAERAETDPALQSLAHGAAQAAEVALGTPSSPNGAPAELGRRYRLFLSQSVPQATLDAALAEASGHTTMSVVYRGARADQRLADVVTRVRQRIQVMPAGTTPPAVEIDPPRFAEGRIEVVPTLVAYEDGKPIAWARGLLSAEQLEARLRGGERGDLGKLGPTYPVEERDFTEVLKARAAAIDMDALKAKAMQRFWERQTFVPLPAAREDAQRTVDPSIEVTADIVTPDGKVIARKGDRVNPLQSVPFTQRLVIVDASDATQVQLVKPYMSFQGRRVTVLTTQVDRARGWAQLAEREGELGHPIQLLTATIADRFHIERVPSIVEAQGDHFVVRELKVPDTLEKEHAGPQPSPR
ncbi:MAG TPA: TrbC family F-type conjugative pilus assembly protein [Rhodanobacteraceae bacterium]|nr:TrbC family F-type conjugative pilus assembly protein [Rhodanobacteraceae bacterium]